MHCAGRRLGVSAPPAAQHCPSAGGAGSAHVASAPTPRTRGLPWMPDEFRFAYCGPEPSSRAVFTVLCVSVRPSCTSY